MKTLFRRTKLLASKVIGSDRVFPENLYFLRKHLTQECIKWRLFYPLFSGGKDTLLKIINMNIKIINIIILLTLTILVSMMNSYVSKNIYTGIIIGFVPIFLIYLNNIFN